MRKNRLDSNLTQKEVAEILKTSDTNVRNWEANRGKVSLQFKQQVYKFVGFCPCDVSLSIGLKLKERREYFGLTIKKLSKILNVDSCTIAYWERGEHLLNQNSVRIIENFFSLYVTNKVSAQEVTVFTQDNSFPHSKIPIYVAYESNWDIARKVTAWRLGAGLSQRQLAKLSGICFQSICRWENGKRILSNDYQKQLLKAIIKYLDSF